MVAVGHWDTNYKLLQSEVTTNHPRPTAPSPPADEQRNLLENDPHPPQSQPSLCSTLPPSPSHKYVLSLAGRGGPSHVTCVTTSHHTHLHSARDGQQHLSYSFIVPCRMFHLFSILIYPWPHLNMESLKNYQLRSLPLTGC